MKIKPVQTEREVEEVRDLFQEYEAFLNIDLCFQRFEEELASLPGEYSRPNGELIIALDGKRIVGCVAIRKLDSSICEMKRLFVKQEFRKNGWADNLLKKLLRWRKNLVIH